MDINTIYWVEMQDDAPALFGANVQKVTKKLLYVDDGPGGKTRLDKAALGTEVFASADEAVDTYVKDVKVRFQAAKEEWLQTREFAIKHRQG